MADSGWTPADHACRFCGGRIMQSGRAFRCFNCEAATASGRVNDICGCGLAGAPGRFPFRCAPNPSPTPANPAAVVIVRADAPVRPAKEPAA